MKTRQSRAFEVIMHFRPWIDGVVSPKGGLTVFARHVPSDSFMTVKTSVCSINDAFCKSVGVQQAKESEGSIKLPFLYRNGGYIELRSVLQDIFVGTYQP